MDNKKALSKVAESCELLRMVEDLTNPNLQNQLSQSAYGGIRITIRNIREVLVECHKVLSSNGGRNATSTSSTSTREDEESIDESSTKNSSTSPRIEREWQGSSVSQAYPRQGGESLEFFTKSSGFPDDKAGVGRRSDMRMSAPRYLD